MLAAIDPVFALLVRLRGNDRRLARPGSQFPDELRVRLCAGWQHRPDRGTRYPAEPGVRAGAGLRRQSPPRPGHGYPGPGYSLRRSPRSLHRAVADALASHLLPGKEKAAGDGGQLYHASHSIILAHEDKTYDGALIASLSIPWGEAMSDDDVGGYHLVWTRDMCHSATGLLAAGNTRGSAARPHLSGLHPEGGWRLLPEFLDQRRTPLARHPVGRSRLPCHPRLAPAPGQGPARTSTLIPWC